MKSNDPTPEEQAAIIARFHLQKEASRRRSHEHRQRLIDAGYVRVSGWVPRHRREATLAFIAAQGEYASVDRDARDPLPQPLTAAIQSPLADDPSPPASDDVEQEQASALQALLPRPVVPRAPRAGEMIALIVDVTATGTDPEISRMADFGLIAVTYENGEMGDILGTVSQTAAPACALDPGVLGPHFGPAGIVIAHDARVIRPLCEPLAPGLMGKAWACLASDIAWSGGGSHSHALDDLLRQAGWSPSGPGALDRCHAILELLAAPLAGHSGSTLSHLLAAARTPHVRIWTDGAPADSLGALESRGYRSALDDAAASGWIDVPKAQEAAEIAFLQEEIYRGDYQTRREEIKARNRFEIPLEAKI